MERLSWPNTGGYCRRRAAKRVEVYQCHPHNFVNRNYARDRGERGGRERGQREEREGEKEGGGREGEREKY